MLVITGAAKRITRKDTKEVYHRWWSQINDTRWVSLYTIFDYWRTSTNMKRDKQVKLILWLEDIEHITPLWVKLWLLAQKFVSLIEIHFPTGLILGSLSFSSLALSFIAIAHICFQTEYSKTYVQTNQCSNNIHKEAIKTAKTTTTHSNIPNIRCKSPSCNKQIIHLSLPKYAPCMEYLPAFIIKSKPFM